MFNNCCNLVAINLSHFDTQEVINMQNMFDYCYKLIKIDLSSFNTQNVTNMSNMYEECKSLFKINRKSFIKNKNKLLKSKLFIIEI